MAKLIHSMIRVLDLDRSIAFYRDGFGMVESHRMDFPTFTLVYLRDLQSGTEIELTHNKGVTDPYSHGSGYGHVAFCVDDLDAQRTALIAAGAAVGDVKSLAAASGSARFFFVTDPDGYKIEVLERGGHYV